MSIVQLRIDYADLTTPVMMRGIAQLNANVCGAWTLIGDMAVNSVRTNFEVGGRPQAWVPLSEGRIRQKGHARPLIDTHRMMESTEYKLIGNGVELYNTVDYADIHQLGTSHVPARPFLVLQSEDYVAFRVVMDRCIQRFFGR